MLRPLSAAAALPLLLAASGASAFTLAFAGFEPTGDQFYGCGLEINGSDQLVVVDPPEAPGLAVFGGPNDLFVDGNESVAFEFLGGPATFVRYTVSAIAFTGGATLTGFDETLAPIGSVEVSGTGEKDVSALFGGVPLGGFRVTNAVGGHRIGSVSFQPPGGAVAIDLRDAPDEQQESLQYCGVGFAAVAGLLYIGPSGLGIGSDAGVLDSSIEGGESLVVELDAPVRGLSYTHTWNSLDPPTVRVTAFGTTGAPYGDPLVLIQNTGPTDVTALYGGASLTGFQLDVLNGDLVLGDLVVVPEPAAAPAAALAALAGLRARRSGARTRAARQDEEAASASPA